MFQSARVLVSRAQFVEAGRLYDAVVTAAPTDPAGYLERAMCRELQSDFSGAIADYRKYLELGGSNVDRAGVERAIQGNETARQRGIPYRSTINTLVLETPPLIPDLSSITNYRPVLAPTVRGTSASLPASSYTAPVVNSAATSGQAIGQATGKTGNRSILRLIMLCLTAAWFGLVVLPIAAEAGIIALVRSDVRNALDRSTSDTLTSLANYTKPFLRPLQPILDSISQQNVNNRGVYGIFDSEFDTILLMLIVAVVIYTIIGLIGLAIIRRILVQFMSTTFKPTAPA